MATISSITWAFWPTRRHQSEPEPARSETARPIVSSGVRLANSWLIWKVRTMPRRTRWCGCRWVMSLPSSRMRPSLGRNTPVRRLIRVVLPAPFGPIRAWRAPFSMTSETLLVATVPSNRFSRLMVSNTADMRSPGDERAFARARGRNGRRRAEARGAEARGAKAHDTVASSRRPLAEALATDQHDHDEDAPEPGMPVPGGERGQRIPAGLE